MCTFETGIKRVHMHAMSFDFIKYETNTCSRRWSRIKISFKDKIKINVLIIKKELIFLGIAYHKDTSVHT